MVKSLVGVFVTFFALAASSPIALAQPPAKDKKTTVRTTSKAAAAKPEKKAQQKKVARKPAEKTAKAKPTRKKAVAEAKASKAKASKAKSSRTKTAKAKSSKQQVVAQKRPAKTARVAAAAAAGPVSNVSFAPAPAPSVAPLMSAGDIAGLNHIRDPLALASNAAIVIDQQTSQVLFEKNAAVALPIASLTKLMTAMVVIEARQNMEEMLEVTSDDIDREKNTGSRLRVGTQLSRADMLHIALMSSENRAASALGRNYPGGLPAFVAAMNARAKALGMTHTHYVEPTGLSSSNVSTARDLAKLVAAASRQPAIRHYSTYPQYSVDIGRSQLNYTNSNRLVRSQDWDIGLQKTGYIAEAGRCLVMQARIDGRPVIMVFLDSKGKDSRLGDAARVRKSIENGKLGPVTTQTAAKHS